MVSLCDEETGYNTLVYKKLQDRWTLYQEDAEKRWIL